MTTFWFSGRQINRTTRRRLNRGGQPFLEDLEGRQLLSTFTVTNTHDSGTGSLRQAIISSNATTGSAVNAIDFKIGSGGTHTISLQSALPAVSHPAVIDGNTQPGTGAAPRIVLNGNSAGASAVGLKLTASNSKVEGLAIVNFGSDGVDIVSASGDVIADDYIGVGATGSKAGNGGNGVAISGSSSNDTVGGTTSDAGNLISGNQAHGVVLNGADDIVVQGNWIGTNATGTAAMGNGDSGVYLDNGADNNLIGGTTADTRNVLSGNDLRGVHISGASSDNLVEGNYIGTNAAGKAAVPNEDSGVLIDGGSENNTIGGTTAGTGNVLSGNELRGMHISGGASGNLVEGNLIGTNAAGTAAVPNDDSGVLIDGNSFNNTIGGTTAGSGNTISGNLEEGVHLTGCSSGTVVEGNVIGMNSRNTAAVPNALDGVLVDGGSSQNTIGGTASGAGNTISGNGHHGVSLNNAGNGNLLEADTIDSNGYGPQAGSPGDGVSIVDTAHTSVINCKIDSNAGWGIFVNDGSDTVLTGNTVLNNGLGGIKIS